MLEPFTIIALSGSLRLGSFNTAVLRSAVQLAPDGVAITLYDYSDVPLYNADIEPHDAAERLKAAISTADAMLLCSPEYNYSVPGVLKNALDWVSRPGFQSVLVNKPVGIMSASMGAVGGARGQAHLKNVVGAMLGQVAPLPEFCLGAAHTKVSESELTDESSRAFLAGWLGQFADWAQRHR